MAFRAGTTTKFYLSNTAGALQDISTYVNSSSVPLDTQALDTTTFGAAASLSVPGLKGGGAVSLSGPADATVVGQLGSLWSAGSVASFVYGPGGSVAGQTRVAGSCFVTSLSPGDSAVADLVTWATSLQLTDAITISTF